MSSIITKYKYAYTVAAAFALLVIPAGAYVLFSKYHLLKTLQLFPSTATWSAAVILAWVASVVCVEMAVNWNDSIDEMFRKRGFTEIDRVKVIWNLTIIPAILGCLFALYSFLENSQQGQEFDVIRLVVLALGFIPVTFYGLLRAGWIADRIVQGGPVQKETPDDYLMTKWWPVVVIIMTVLLTPFFGAGIAAAQIWRLAPRHRFLLYVLIVLSGLLITLLIGPLAAQMKRAREAQSEAYQAFALYAALTLFTGTAYVFIIKIGALARKKTA